MGSPLATFYGSDRAPSAIGTRNDLVFHASATINNAVQTTTVPLSPIGAGIDLLRLPGAVGAYLSLKEAVVSTRKSPSFADKHRSPCYQTTNVTITPGTNPYNVYFNTGNPTFFLHVGFVSGAPAGVQISSMGVAPHNGSSVGLDFVVNSPFGTTGPAIALTQILDPNDGVANFDPNNVGFDFTFAGSNSTGGNQVVTVVCYGANYAFDWTQLFVQYIDWLGQPYNVGIFDDRAFSQPFGLGQKVPNPITNPNQSNFGSLSFTVLNSNTSFQGSYTYDVILNASLEYQLG